MESVVQTVHRSPVFLAPLNPPHPLSCPSLPVCVPMPRFPLVTWVTFPLSPLSLIMKIRLHIQEIWDTFAPSLRQISTFPLSLPYPVRPFRPTFHPSQCPILPTSIRISRTFSRRYPSVTKTTFLLVSASHPIPLPSSPTTPSPTYVRFSSPSLLQCRTVSAIVWPVTTDQHHRTGRGHGKRPTRSDAGVG